MMNKKELNNIIDKLNGIFQRNFDEAVASGKCIYHITTSVNFEALWFNWLPHDIFKQNCCSTCGKFLKEYGGLVTIDDIGTVTSVLFENRVDVPEEYLDSFEICLTQIKEHPTVVSVFKERSDLKIVGVEKAEGFNHFHLDISKYDSQNPIVSGTTVQAFKNRKNAKHHLLKNTLLDLHRDLYPYFETKMSDPCLQSLRGIFNWTNSIVKQLKYITSKYPYSSNLDCYMSNFIWRVIEKHPEYHGQRCILNIFKAGSARNFDILIGRYSKLPELEDAKIQFQDINILNNKNLDEITWNK